VSQFLLLPLLPTLSADRAVRQVEGRAKPVENRLRYSVKNSIITRLITFDDYTRCLNEEIEVTRRQSCIRSNLHEVYIVSETKIALSPYDDKRYIVPDSTEMLP